MHIKITAVSSIILASGVTAQELQWIRRMPDVVSFANSPYTSDGAAYGFDYRAGKIIVFSHNFFAYQAPSNFFYYDGENFTIANLFNNYNPDQKKEICDWVPYRSQFLYNTARNTFHFSRNDSLGTFDGTRWRIDGLYTGQSSWPQQIIAPADNLSGERFVRFVYDNNRNVIICIMQSSWMNGIAEYDGTYWRYKAWGDVPPQTEIHIGQNFNAVYDSERQKTVIFGGKWIDDHNRTYEWDGVRIVERQVFGPAPRHAHLMTYDSNIKKTVLFGGGNRNNVFTDTWTFDGNQWQQLNTNFTGTVLPNNGGTWYEANPSNFDLIYDPNKKIHVLLGASYDANRTMVSLERCELVPTCDLPTITLQPTDQFVPTGFTVTFFAQANNGISCSNGITYQWQRRNPSVEDANSPAAWYNLQNDGIFANTTTSTLLVQNPTPAVATGFRCVITNGCACYDGTFKSVTTNVVNFAVSCPADFNADGGVDFSDVEAFFERWENGC